MTLSAFIAFRDRGDVTAYVRYPKQFEQVFVNAVNSGRRPVTLRQLVLQIQDGNPYKYPLLKGENPVRLMESEYHEFPLNVQNTDIQQWEKTKIIKAYLEDSLGKQYPVEDLVENINEYVKHQTTPI